MPTEVIASTQVLKTCVEYVVIADGKRVWERVVYFGSKKANRAGGQAFAQASREQERAVIKFTNASK